MVENMERVERACLNMRNALRPQAPGEGYDDTRQETPIRAPASAVKPDPGKQQSRVIRLRFNRRSESVANPAQIVQSSQDVAARSSSLSEVSRDGDTVTTVSAGHARAARTTVGDTVTTDTDLYVVKPRKSWGRMRKFPQSTYDRGGDEEIEVDWCDNTSNPPWEGYYKADTHPRPSKKRKYIQIKTGGGSDVSW